MDIGKPVRDFWGRRTRFQKIGLVAGLVFIGLGISTYVGDPFGLGAVVTLSNGKAVHSNDFKQAYFVAWSLRPSSRADNSQPSSSSSRCVSATPHVPEQHRNRGQARTHSVNDYAKEVSDWGDGGSTDAHFSTSDDGASEAEDCAGS